MSFERPSGYRITRQLGLTTLIRGVVGEGGQLRRDEALRILSKVAAELAMVPRPDEVFRRLSGGSVASEELDAVCGPEASLLARAAAFVDVVHLHLHEGARVDPWLDLRFEVQFYEDPAEPHGAWTYVLVSTNSSAFELGWRRVPGLLRYPLPESDDDQARHNDDWVERFGVWERILAAYPRSGALAWRAPDPQLYAELTESLHDPSLDAKLGSEGKVTVTAVLAEVHRLLGPSAPSGVEAELVAARR